MSLSLKELYQTRAPADSLPFRRKVWEILCEDVFARWVRPDDVVLDLGAGYCEFINAVRARRRIGVGRSAPCGRKPQGRALAL